VRTKRGEGKGENDLWHIKQKVIKRQMGQWDRWERETDEKERQMRKRDRW